MDLSNFIKILILASLIFVPVIQQEQQQNESAVARRMGLGRETLLDERYPQPWELRWRKANLSETDENGFILLPCFHELNAFPLESLYNKMFRIQIKTELQKVKNCQIRFPTGVRLRYRFRFNDANTHVFFAYGNSAQRMVAFSRKISTADRPGTHNDVWKGVLRVPCRFSLLVFNPFVSGEEFEFHILDGHEYVDKCSDIDQKN